MVTRATTVISLNVLEKSVALNDDKKKKIGILAGTFNPPHLGQLVLANSALEELQLDKVFWMPSAIPNRPTQQNTISSFYRLKMLQIITQDNINFDIEMCELKKGGISDSFDTMLELKLNNPNNEYYFIVGENLINDLKSWNKINELAQICNIAIGCSDISSVKKLHIPHITFYTPKLEIRSSQIRSLIRMNKSVKYLIPDNLYDFIQRYQLYNGWNI